VSEPRTIPLWPEGCPHDVANPHGRPRLEIHLPAEPSDKPPLGRELGAERRAAVVVLPGGGYQGNAPHEGTPFGELFAANGMVAAVCWYRVAPHGWPAPYADAARAIRMVRSMADELQIDPNRVGLLGFSAGGHNAATLATQPDLHHDEHDDLVSQFSARPDRLMLGYPVISMVSHYHGGSCDNLLGVGADTARRRQFSNELQVTPNNPPTFIFHTDEDQGVPAENALAFVTALRAKNVPTELHLFQPGAHGLGLANEHPRLRVWSGLMLSWLGDWCAPAFD